jgi:hypothetical protein
MTEGEINTLVSEKFPGAVGVILTGSRKDLSNAGGDVDLLIFDTTHPNVVSHSFEYQETIVDCTIFPILDSHSVILNQAEDKRGVILSMIITGSILFDTDNILSEIQAIVKNLQLRLQKQRISPLFTKAVADLPAIRRYLDREFNQIEMFVFLCDIVTVISKIEIHTVDYWGSTLYRKAKKNAEHSSLIFTDLKEIFEETTKTQNKDRLIKFIDTYWAQIEATEEARLPDSFSVDLYMGALDYQKFFNQFIPLIKSNNDLSRIFYYAHRSDRKYNRLYSYDVTLTFRLENETQKDGTIKELVSLLRQNGFVDPILNIVELPEGLLSGSDIVINKIRSLLFTFRLANAEETRPEFSNSRLLLLLCVEISAVLEISSQDAFQALEMLFSKWILPRPQHNNTAVGKEFSALITRRTKDLQTVFQHHKHKFFISNNNNSTNSGVTPMALEILKLLQ